MNIGALGGIFKGNLKKRMRDREIRRKVSLI